MEYVIFILWLLGAVNHCTSSVYMARQIDLYAGIVSHAVWSTIWPALVALNLLLNLLPERVKSRIVVRVMRILNELRKDI